MTTAFSAHDLSLEIATRLSDGWTTDGSTLRSTSSGIDVVAELALDHGKAIATFVHRGKAVRRITVGLMHRKQRRRLDRVGVSLARDIKKAMPLIEECIEDMEARRRRQSQTNSAIDALSERLLRALPGESNPKTRSDSARGRKSVEITWSSKHFGAGQAIVCESHCLMNPPTAHVHFLWMYELTGRQHTVVADILMKAYPGLVLEEGVPDPTDVRCHGIEGTAFLAALRALRAASPELDWRENRGTVKAQERARGLARQVAVMAGVRIDGSTVLFKAAGCWRAAAFRANAHVSATADDATATFTVVTEGATLTASGVDLTALSDVVLMATSEWPPGTRPEHLALTREWAMTAWGPARDSYSFRRHRAAQPDHTDPNAILGGFGSRVTLHPSEGTVTARDPGREKTFASLAFTGPFYPMQALYLIKALDEAVMNPPF